MFLTNNTTHLVGLAELFDLESQRVINLQRRARIRQSRRRRDPFFDVSQGALADSRESRRLSQPNIRDIESPTLRTRRRSLNDRQDIWAARVSE